jgi:hypothetical protein
MFSNARTESAVVAFPALGTRFSLVEGSFSLVEVQHVLRVCLHSGAGIYYLLAVPAAGRSRSI